jgi:hypothetical protein
MKHVSMHVPEKKTKKPKPSKGGFFWLHRFFRSPSPEEGLICLSCINKPRSDKKKQGGKDLHIFEKVIFPCMPKSLKK